MFPTKGYLQNAVCPYYQHGLCHRPYCHFKHKKKGKFTIFHGVCSCYNFCSKFGEILHKMILESIHVLNHFVCLSNSVCIIKVKHSCKILSAEIVKNVLVQKFVIKIIFRLKFPKN